MRTGKFQYILALLLCFFSLGSFAQQTVLMNAANNGQTITANGCTLILYDSGGVNGNYGNSEDYTITICMPAGFPAIIDASFVCESQSFDYMSIYRGNSIAGQAIANRVGSTTSGAQSTYHYEVNSNCVTLVWHSDGSVNHPGFTITFTCGTPCQEYTIVPDITATWNAAESRYEACSNEELGFAFHGNYMNNDSPNGYHQSDATTTWTWWWIDATGRHESAGEGLNSFDAEIEPGAYYLNVSAIDVNGCEQVYDEQIFVVISLPPTFNGTTITPEICPGEILELTGRVQPPEEWTMEIPEVIQELHCFEDEIGVAQSMCFNHTAFAPGQSIQSINDIESICIDIEHSYIGDLEVWITCPNGTRLDLFNGSVDGNCGGQHLGEPVDAYDTDCIPGTTYHYCWTNTAATSIEGMAANAPSHNYTDNEGNHITGARYIPAGDYLPRGNWNVLVGCPINGEWCVNMIDHLGSDDGIVTQVELHFADHIVPAGDNVVSYQTTFPDINSTTGYLWEGEYVVNGNVANAQAQTTMEATGQYQYTFHATDDFGCTYDTTVTATVRPLLHPMCCIPPTPVIQTLPSLICADRANLSVQNVPNGNTGAWSVTAYPNGDDVNNVVTFGNPNAPNTLVVVNGWGTYTFRWDEYYMGRDDCTEFTEITVTFREQPRNDFNFAPAIGCFGDETTISYMGNMGGNADAVFHWDFAGGFAHMPNDNVGPHIVNWVDAGVHGV